jgi:Cd(II)/Pb(II)-responsive transcriptional regulator
MMKIGELAKLASCDVETIRYYEKVGLLAEPPRTETGYRAYTQEHLQSLRFIRQCRTLRMGLSEIRTLIRLKNDRFAACQSVNELLDQHVQAVDQQLQDLQNLRAQLVQLREQCITPHVIDDCGILQELNTRSAECTGS